MIDTLIFDFGGVLYDIDYFAATRAFANLSLNPYKLLQLDRAGIFNLPSEFEKGNAEEDDFRNYLRKEYEIIASDEELDKAWNAMLLGLKDDAVSFVNSINNSYKTALLSNTNSIHYRKFFPETEELMSLFDIKIFSYMTGMRKPDVEIYDYTLKKIDSDAENCIFIDDSIINLEGAKAIGMRTFLFEPSHNLSDILHSI
jgi:putative hydrolase of the HAD superfamily